MFFPITLLPIQLTSSQEVFQKFLSHILREIWRTVAKSPLDSVNDEQWKDTYYFTLSCFAGHFYTQTGVRSQKLAKIYIQTLHLPLHANRAFRNCHSEVSSVQC